MATDLSRLPPGIDWIPKQRGPRAGQDTIRIGVNWISIPAALRNEAALVDGSVLVGTTERDGHRWLVITQAAPDAPESYVRSITRGVIGGMFSQQLDVPVGAYPAHAQFDQVWLDLGPAGAPPQPVTFKETNR